MLEQEAVQQAMVKQEQTEAWIAVAGQFTEPRGNSPDMHTKVDAI